MADYISRNNFGALLGESLETLAKEAFQRMVGPGGPIHAHCRSTGGLESERLPC